MAVKLVDEVSAYMAAHPELTTAERLVLYLIADRARLATRVAFAGADGWSLSACSGLGERALRKVFVRLAGRGIEVRVVHGRDVHGRPVYATWDRPPAYQLPILLGGTPGPPTGGTPGPPSGDLVGGTVGTPGGTVGTSGGPHVPPNTMPSINVSNHSNQVLPSLRSAETHTADDTHSPTPPLRALDGGSTMARKTTPPQPALWPTAVATPTPATSPTVSAQTIVAEWIDRCRAKPPGRVIGQMAKLIGEMLGEGIDPDNVRRGIAAWMGKGLHPSTLPSVVNEVMNQGAAPRPSTTEQRVNDALGRGDRLQAAHDRKALGA